MKKKLIFKISILVIVILIVVGVIIFIPKQKTKEDKVLRKIYEEEINNITTAEIVQYYVAKELSLEETDIVNVRLVATNKNGQYLVRLEIKDEPGKVKETIMEYLGDGEWKVNFPLE